jgi:hypothetical protein
MAGYSGTPLPQKLGIKPKLKVAFFELPSDVKKSLDKELSDCELVTSFQQQLDFAMIFIKSQAEMKQQFPAFARRLAPAGILWTSWPKKTSGIATDLNENDVRRIGLETGLVDVKVCAVNEVWSGLKFVIRVKDRNGAQTSADARKKSR